MSDFTNAQIKLIYFAARGVAEVSRILLKVSGIPFEDVRYPFTPKPEGGYSRPEFDADCQAGLFAVNMDRLPILEVNGLKIGQSRAIERYVANRGHLFGSSDEERALIDCVVESIRDIREKYSAIRYRPASPEKDEALAKWLREDLVDWLKKLEKSLPVNESQPFVVGSTVSYADISIWHLLRDYFSDKEVVKAAIEAAKATRLTLIADRVEQVEAVKNHLTTRHQDIF